MMGAPPMDMGYGGGSPYGGNGMMGGAPSYGGDSSAPCKFGSSCRFAAMGTCRYFHPAQGNGVQQQPPAGNGNNAGSFTNGGHVAMDKPVSGSQRPQPGAPAAGASAGNAAPTRTTRRAHRGTASQRIFAGMHKQYDLQSLETGVSITWWDARTGTETRETDANINILSTKDTEEALGMTPEYGRDGLGPMVRMAATDLDLFWSLVHYYHNNNSTGSGRWDEKLRAAISAFAENGVPSGDLPEEVMLFRVRIPSEEGAQ